MYSPEQILEAAKAVQPVLHKLLSEPRATEMQSSLQSFIQSKDIDQIWDSLDQYPQTKQWRIQYLKAVNSSKTRSNSQLLGNSQLPGDVTAQSGMIFACPLCDYRYAIFFQGMELTSCDKHPDTELHLV